MTTHNLYKKEECTTLEEAVQKFFKYLSYTEGNTKNFVTVSCGRALMVEPLGDLIRQMKALSKYNSEQSIGEIK